jgi:hypothetical protein
MRAGSLVIRVHGVSIRAAGTSLSMTGSTTQPAAEIESAGMAENDGPKPRGGTVLA